MVTISLDEITVNRIFAVNKMNTMGKRRSFVNENRKTCALVCKLEGKSIYKTGTESYILDNHHVMLLLRGLAYTIDYKEDGEFYIVEFECNPEYTGYGMCSFTLKSMSVIHKLFNDLEVEWTFKKFAYVQKSMKILYEIIIILQQTQSNLYMTESMMDKIRPAVKYLESNSSDPSLNVEILARQSNISISYFRKLFTNIYMIPPARYLQKIRISKAKDLLISNSYTVGEIAEMVGYSSIYYFSYAFRKEMGLPPSEFLLRYHNNS